MEEAQITWEEARVKDKGNDKIRRQIMQKKAVERLWGDLKEKERRGWDRNTKEEEEGL